MALEDAVAFEVLLGDLEYLGLLQERLRDYAKVRLQRDAFMSNDGPGRHEGPGGGGRRKI